MTKRELVKQYLDRFPTLPSHTLAKKIYKENPLSFRDAEAARWVIMALSGKAGKEHIADKTHVDRKVTFELPESYADDFTPFEIKQSKTLILSDLHFPYQHNESILKAIEYGKKKKINCVLINGDLLDFAGISRHEKDWRQRTVFEEFEAVRLFLKSLRKAFPQARIIFKEGNHDERWEKFLFLKAPEIFDDPEFTLESRLRLGELKIEIVKNKKPIRIGKLTVLHGHELTGGSGGVNPARATFLKTLESVIVGHYHKTSQHTEASMFGDVFSVNSTGCLCGLNPHYMPINKWNLGFAYVELDIKSGNYHLENLKIINGRVY